MKKNYLSIDIGGTNVKYAELDNGGHIIEEGKIKTSKKRISFSDCRKIYQKGSKGIGILCPRKDCPYKNSF